MNRTLVIAEPGCTHEGDKATMLRLLDTANECGADVWKPQFVSDHEQMLARRHITLDHSKYSYYKQAYSWLQWPKEWHAEFSARCHELGMKYAVTCFLPKDVWEVEPYADILKIASFENGDRKLLEAARSTGKRIIRSAGMMPCSFADSHGGWLLCTTAYPAPLDSLHLAAIRNFHFSGLSDHSRHVLTGAVAVGAGAYTIECHYRLNDCDQTNPDFAVAFAPEEFAQYIRNIRVAEALVGETCGKLIEPCEEWALPFRVTT